MKKFLFLFAFLSFGIAFSQVSMSGNKLVKDGQTYRLSEYKEVFKNQEAINYFAKARTNNTVANVFAALGGGFMGFGLARALSGGKTEILVNGQVQTVKQDKSGAWTAVGIGAGLVGIGIPFVLAAKKNADKAISIENGGTTAFQPYFKLESTGTGIVLSYNF